MTSSPHYRAGFPFAPLLLNCLSVIPAAFSPREIGEGIQSFIYFWIPDQVGDDNSGKQHITLRVICPFIPVLIRSALRGAQSYGVSCKDLKIPLPKRSGISLNLEPVN